MISKISYVILAVVLLLVAGAGSLGLYVVLKDAHADDSRTKVATPAALLVFEDYTKIMLYNTVTKETRQLGTGESPLFSSDKRYVSYVVPGPANLYGGKEPGVYIYDLEDGVERQFLSMSEYLENFDEESLWTDMYPFTLAAWSPDDQYLLVDVGTSPVHSQDAFDISTKKKMFGFTVVGIGADWVDNNTVIFTDVQQVPNPRPYGGGEGSGVAMIDRSGTKRILLTADELTDYRLVSINENGEIIVGRTKVSTLEEWDTLNEYPEDYFIYKKGVLENTVAPLSPDEQLAGLVGNRFTADTQIAFADALSNDPDWVAFPASVFPGDSPAIHRIFVINVNDPNTLTEIGYGFGPDW